MSRQLTDKALIERDAKRDIWQEALEGLRDIKAGRTTRKYTVDSFPIIRVREKSGLSQSEFAKLLGVSVRTLQDWEQGRRAPSGAAKSLLLIAAKKPGVLREVFKIPRKAA